MATDTRLQRDLTALVDQAQRARLDRALKAAPAAPGIGPATKRKAIAAASSVVGGTGSGIASPLTENTTKREYYAVQTVASTDGVITVRVRRVKKIVMKDANNRVVEFRYGNA